MPPDAEDLTDRPRGGRARLRRSGRHLVRLGGGLAVVSLLVTLLGGWATRSLLDDLQANSAELIDGTATISLTEGERRTLYVTGGLIAPGDLTPTPVEQVSCTITGPGGQLPFQTLADQGQKIGLDTALARFQVIGSFQAQETGEHDLECVGRGVVVAPEVGPANALLRLGGLMLGTLGTFVGLSMLLIGGVLLFVVRGGADEGPIEEVAPPEEGADEWWEDEVDSHADGSTPPGEDEESEPAPGADVAPASPAPEGEGQYVELTHAELEALSPEEIDELVSTGQLVWVDDEGTDDSDGDASRLDG